MQIYGAPEGTRGCNQLLFFFFFFLCIYFFYIFFFHVPSGASNLYISHSNFFFFSPFPGHQILIFWPVENWTTWNLRYLMLRDAGWALRHWRSCSVFYLALYLSVLWKVLFLCLSLSLSVPVSLFLFRICMLSLLPILCPTGVCVCVCVCV